MKYHRSSSIFRHRFLLAIITIVLTFYCVSLYFHPFDFLSRVNSDNSTAINTLSPYPIILDDCECLQSDGTIENMCYSRPDNATVIGKRFNCNLVRYLEKLGLSGSIPRMVDLDAFDYSVVVTAASSTHYRHVSRLIFRMRKFYPDVKLILYNLGLTSPQLIQLSEVCSLEIRDFNFDLYGDHVRNLGEFRWKPIIIAETLRDYSSMWYMDSSIVPKRGHFRNVPDLIKCRDSRTIDVVPSIDERDQREELSAHESGFDKYVHMRNLRECKKSKYLLHSFTGHGIYAATHPGMFEWFPTNIAEIRKRKAKMYEAGLAYIVKSSEMIRNVLKWYVLCALERECMAPAGAVPYCFFDGLDQYTDYAKCHRYDQSALNILLANANYYDRHYYSSEIVDFFSIQREIEEEDFVDLAFLNCVTPSLVDNI